MLYPYDKVFNHLHILRHRISLNFSTYIYARYISGSIGMVTGVVVVVIVKVSGCVLFPRNLSWGLALIPNPVT